MSNAVTPPVSTTQLETNTNGLPSNTRSLNGDTGTQIFKDGTANNASTVLYTVTAGKTLYLTSVHMSAIVSSAALDSCYIYATTDADVSLGNIIMFTSRGAVATTQHENRPFVRPLKLLAGYKIKFTSNSTTVYATANIHGWEE